MPVLPTLFSQTEPGVYVSESYGSIPQGLATHSDVYMLGTSTKPGAVVGTPQYVSNVDDFANQFGSTPSTAAVAMFFDQRPGRGLWYLAVQARNTRTVTVPTATPAATYSITFDGFTVSHVATATDTPATIVAALTALVNTQLMHQAYMLNGVLRSLDMPKLTAATATANISLGTATAAAGTPTAFDVTEAARRGLLPEMPQGFILAPEFYQAYTVGSDRTFLAQQLEAIAADPRYCWVSIVDCGAATATATTGAGAINLALAEKALVASPKGHSLFYFPYLKNGLGTLVPPSPMVAGVALRRYLQQGFRQPPAGMDYPVYGATDTSFPVTGDVNGQLNAQNVNCVRRLPNGGGIVVYGARTMSTNALYRYMTVRVIFNVLNRTLEAAYQRIPFQSVDGQGVLFGLMKATATGILETMRQGGALFGATPEDAYRVVCDLTNNGANDLENGLVRVTVLAKPSPMVEFVSVEVTRMPLGAILSEVVSSGDTGNIRNLAV